RGSQGGSGDQRRRAADFIGANQQDRFSGRFPHRRVHPLRGRANGRFRAARQRRADRWLRLSGQCAGAAGSSDRGAVEQVETKQHMTQAAPGQDDDDAERRRLGERLREARKYLGLKQEEVATYLKIPRTALTDIENGQRRVEAIELTRLAKLYRQPMG